MKDNNLLNKLCNLIDKAFNTHYKNGAETQTRAPEPELKLAPVSEEQPKTPALYESIEEYTATTGKRFRMTKDQKELGMTREEAFKLTYGEY